MPREDIARFIDLCCAAAFDDGSRISAPLFVVSILGMISEGLLTGSSFINFYTPSLFSERDGA